MVKRFAESEIRVFAQVWRHSEIARAIPPPTHTHECDSGQGCTYSQWSKKVQPQPHQNLFPLPYSSCLSAPPCSSPYKNRWKHVTMEGKGIILLCSPLSLSPSLAFHLWGHRLMCLICFGAVGRENAGVGGGLKGSTWWRIKVKSKHKEVRLSGMAHGSCFHGLPATHAVTFDTTSAWGLHNSMCRHLYAQEA